MGHIIMHTNLHLGESASCGGISASKSSRLFLASYAENGDTRMTQDNGWEQSAKAWINDMGDTGDFSRQFILDPAMLSRIENRGFATALDVGCGEGRFCRMLSSRGISATGIDPTKGLLQRARSLDPQGNYQEAYGESLPFADKSFDLVVSYLTLIDIEGAEAAIAEMARVLKPGGTLLIANLNSFATANGGEGWITSDHKGQPHFRIDNYHEERADWVSWRGVSIRNWHRPMSAYMRWFLSHGLTMVHFDEPLPVGGDAKRQEWYRRVPYFVVMEWRKPAS